MDHRAKPLALLFICVLSALSGCTSVRETFAGHDPDQLWTALKAVASAPDYGKGDPTDRWTVRENQVWVDEQGSRIEVYRRLERDLHMPGSTPQHQEREWKLRVRMIERDPPTVEFTSRQWGVPAHTWDEGARYFDEVWELLATPTNQSTTPEPAGPSAG